MKAKYALALAPEQYRQLIRALQWAHDRALEPGPVDEEWAARIRDLLKFLEGR